MFPHGRTVARHSRASQEEYKRQHERTGLYRFNPLGPLMAVCVGETRVSLTRCVGFGGGLPLPTDTCAWLQDTDAGSMRIVQAY